MDKCLVYFMTSIKANEIVLAKLRNSKKITTEINEDLLEDAFIENKQALDMALIYSDIQSGMMDAFVSVISNNLNGVMKLLTLISIILMIPTLIASLFGMNVPNFMENSLWALPSIILGSLILSFLGVMLFRKRHWFLDKERPCHEIRPETNLCSHHLLRFKRVVYLFSHREPQWIFVHII